MVTMAGRHASPDPHERDADVTRFFLGLLAQSVTRQVMASTPRERLARTQVAFALFLDCLDLGLDDAAYAIIGGLRADALLALPLVA